MPLLCPPCHACVLAVFSAVAPAEYKCLADNPAERDNSGYKLLSIDVPLHESIYNPGVYDKRSDIDGWGQTSPCNHALVGGDKQGHSRIAESRLGRHNNSKDTVMRLNRLIALLGLLSLGACHGGFTAQPRATTFEASSQPYMRSASHWNVLAANEAENLRSVLNAGQVLSVQASNATASPFEQAYHSMLTSQLVQNNVAVALNPQSASHFLEYDIQVVRHEDRKTLLPRPGTTTALFAIGVIGANVRNWTDQELALIPLGLGLEALSLLWRDTNDAITEVIVNTRLHDGSRIVAADSRVYYFSAEDQHNFQGQGRRFEVVGHQGGVQ